MKAIERSQALLLAMFSIVVFSCQQIPEDDGWLSGYEKKSLKVKVRSAGEADIVYPICLYAFSGDGKLAATQTIADAEEDVALSLSKGEYQIVAVSGTSASYQVPTNPNLNDVITLSGSKGADTPLMAGRANVEISGSSNATVQITLKYVVAALNVKLKDVPANVTDVQLALSPLYSTLSMAGAYGGESQKVKIDCSLTTDNTWSANTVYIFPGSGTETVFSINFKMDDGTEVTYGHTFQGVPEANHLFNVTGTYSGGVIVGGSFDVTDWEGSIDVEFEFGANEIQGDGNKNDVHEPEIDLTGVPQAGTIWNDMIVADIGEADEAGVDLLLMSLDEWEATVSEVDDILSGYSVNGISGWRLPTHHEASVLRARFSSSGRLDLNELIADYDDTLYGLDGEERYLCTKEDAFYSFKFAGGTSTTKAGEVRSYYVRLVKTYRVNLD